MNELVQNNNGQLVTNSILVAEKFNKQHKVVIKTIRELLTSAQNCANLFEESYYSDSYGREQSMYIMNRDGFSLLVMGFTGKDALNFKLDFIEAFNNMEAHIKAQSKPLSSAEILLQQAQLIVEQEKRLNAVEAKINLIEAKTQTRPDYFTIVGYSNLHDISVGLQQASILGKRATLDQYTHRHF